MAFRIQAAWLWAERISSDVTRSPKARFPAASSASPASGRTAERISFSFALVMAT